MNHPFWGSTILGNLHLWPKGALRPLEPLQKCAPWPKHHEPREVFDAVHWLAFLSERAEGINIFGQQARLYYGNNMASIS